MMDVRQDATQQALLMFRRAYPMLVIDFVLYESHMWPEQSTVHVSVGRGTREINRFFHVPIALLRSQQSGSGLLDAFCRFVQEIIADVMRPVFRIATRARAHTGRRDFQQWWRRAA